MESSNHSEENSPLLTQDEFERNMKAFQLLAGTIETKHKPSVITRSRSKMKEELNIKTSDSQDKLKRSNEDHDSKICKKQMKKKRKRNELKKKMKLARNIISFYTFKEFLSNQLEEEQDNTPEKNQVIFNEDAIKIFHDGILEVMLKYLENVKETMEANTIGKALKLEAGRLLGE
ncbi:predicted protein [Naegleria gruberi]|uniref:Predicted protein n=1 Tax=Naegleria gruberi TaxID=5762 RepID=D2VZI3_NAEGR|nr:uncharacterized protein NAEGRDRAFT_53502 [Naegleria gruberi]EFC37851.1 predicted protein [Naegleria gruberi]|eukprot:XP_002670595.1 predicted protein [Naegleria gruberi strain NEG-M]